MARLEQPSLNVIGRINLIEPCCEISAAITNTSYHLLSLHPTLLLFFVYVFVIGIQFLLGYAIGGWDGSPGPRSSLRTTKWFEAGGGTLGTSHCTVQCWRWRCPARTANCKLQRVGAGGSADSHLHLKNWGFPHV